MLLFQPLKGKHGRPHEPWKLFEEGDQFVSSRHDYSKQIGGSMILLNFGHPLTNEQLAVIQAQTGPADFALHDVKTQFNHERPFPDQISTFINSLNIEAATWQTEPILINPPTHNIIAMSLLAELHGRMGYFPAIIRLKPVPGSTPPRFEFAEIINLQAIRDHSRTHR